MDCAVIIVTYNSAEHIDGLLESIPAAAQGATSRVIVVDNGSSDDTVDRVARHEAILTIRAGANLGYAGAINRGRAVADPARSTLILNADVLLTQGCIPQLLAALRVPEIGIVFPRLVDCDGVTLLSLRREPSILRAIGDALLGARFPMRPGWASSFVSRPADYEHDQTIDWATGAALMLSRECDIAVGDWDERYFMYSEEVDTCLRARQAGFRVEYRPKAEVIHLRQGSGRSENLDALRALNEVRLFRTYHGRGSAAAFRIVTGLRWILRFTNPSSWRIARIVWGIESPPSFPGAPPVAPVHW